MLRKSLYGWAMSCVAMLAAGAALNADAQGQQAIVIQGATLIDGNGGAPVPNSVVVVQGNRIAAVGRAGQVQVPAGAQIINANGKWVLPGLMDAKGNWNWQYGEPSLNFGVTSTFVTGPRADQGTADRDAVMHGIFAGPRLFTGVMGLQGPGKDGMKRDPNQFGDPNRIVRNAEDDVNQARQYLADGADLIVWVDGDGAPEVFAPAVKFVAQSGKGLVFRSMGPQTRVSEVCDMADNVVFIHTGNAGAQMAKDPAKWADYIGLPPDQYADMDPAKEKALIQKMVGCKAYLEPDLMAADRGFHKNWARVQQESKDFFANNPLLMTYYPLYSAQSVIENQKSPETYLTPEQIKERTAGFKGHVTFLKDYVTAGGRIVAASDTPQTVPGLGLQQEITAFVEDIGLTPMQAIQSATKWVADGMKQPDLGVIAPGKLADIIVVDADPLADIKNLRKVSTVLFDGKPVALGYHPWYRGYMFARPGNDNDAVIDRQAWVAALKMATWRPMALNGSFGGPGGLDSATSPTPAIEKVSVHTIIRRSPDTSITLTGFNFVRGSVAYFDGIPIPTKVVSRTELQVTVPEDLTGRAGNFPISVKNPQPISYGVSEWGGDTSNNAWILVPFEFTTQWSHNKY